MVKVTWCVLQVADLNKIINSFALFGHTPSAAFIRSYDRRLNQQMGFMHAGDVSSILYAYACLGARPEDRLLEKFATTLQSKLSRCTGDELATVTVALASFQYEARGPWLDDFLIQVSKWGAALCWASSTPLLG